MRDGIIGGKRRAIRDWRNPIATPQRFAPPTTGPRPSTQLQLNASVKQEIQAAAGGSAPIAPAEMMVW